MSSWLRARILQEFNLGGRVALVPGGGRGWGLRRAQQKPELPVSYYPSPSPIAHRLSATRIAKGKRSICPGQNWLPGPEFGKIHDRAVTELGTSLSYTIDGLTSRTQ